MSHIKNKWPLISIQEPQNIDELKDTVLILSEKKSGLDDIFDLNHCGLIEECLDTKDSVFNTSLLSNLFITLHKKKNHSAAYNLSRLKNLITLCISIADNEPLSQERLDIYDEELQNSLTGHLLSAVNEESLSMIKLLLSSEKLAIPLGENFIEILMGVQDEELIDFLISHNKILETIEKEFEQNPHEAILKTISNNIEEWNRWYEEEEQTQLYHIFHNIFTSNGLDKPEDINALKQTDVKQVYELFISLKEKSELTQTIAIVDNKESILKI